MSSDYLNDGVAGFAVLMCVVTLVSAISSNHGWIRVLDFPRKVELILIGVAAIACLTLVSAWRWPLIVALAVAAAGQLWRMHPYLRLAKPEVARTDCDAFTVLGVNVLQKNREHDKVAALIRQVDPDVLLLMETDAVWAAALAPVLDAYPHCRRVLLDNRCGMIFATRLGVEGCEVKDADSTPSIFAQLCAPSGRAFDFIGLHPHAPGMTQGTAGRDAKIKAAAVFRRRSGVPALAMGDFNDVAWSRTIAEFRRTGGFLDPRIGRGGFSSFPSSARALGWPIDQLFITAEFGFRSVRILGDVGSDHRPLVGEVCLPAA